MAWAIIVMCVIVAIALIVIAVVSIGVSGKQGDRTSGLAVVLANTAKHLSGDAEPPTGLVNLAASIPLPHSASSASDHR